MYCIMVSAMMRCSDAAENPEYIFLYLDLIGYVVIFLWALVIFRNNSIKIVLVKNSRIWCAPMDGWMARLAFAYTAYATGRPSRSVLYTRGLGEIIGKLAVRREERLNPKEPIGNRITCDIRESGIRNNNTDMC